MSLPAAAFDAGFFGVSGGVFDDVGGGVSVSVSSTSTAICLAMLKIHFAGKDLDVVCGPIVVILADISDQVADAGRVEADLAAALEEQDELRAEFALFSLAYAMRFPWRMQCVRAAAAYRAGRRA